MARRPGRRPFLRCRLPKLPLSLYRFRCCDGHGGCGGGGVCVRDRVDPRRPKRRLRYPGQYRNRVHPWFHHPSAGHVQCCRRLPPMLLRQQAWRQGLARPFRFALPRGGCGHGHDGCVRCGLRRLHRRIRQRAMLPWWRHGVRPPLPRHLEKRADARVERPSAGHLRPWPRCRQGGVRRVVGDCGPRCRDRGGRWDGHCGRERLGQF